MAGCNAWLGSDIRPHSTKGGSGLWRNERVYGEKISVEIKERRLSDNLLRDYCRRGEGNQEGKGEERDSTETPTFFSCAVQNWHATGDQVSFIRTISISTREMT